MSDDRELEAIRERYARRAGGAGMLDPATWLMVQERQRAILRLLAGSPRLRDVGALRLVEVGCGTGGNLLDLLRMGFRPVNLEGIELLEERVRAAREVLPPALRLHAGDAASAEIEPGSRDLVLQAVVFSSILDPGFQERLAARMWSWLRPGGGVLWYDFTWDNPRNPDVRGVPVRRVRALFPEGRMEVRRVTLAPPIARRAAAIHPSLYGFLNAMPFLRTHVLCWIEKP